MESQTEWTQNENIFCKIVSKSPYVSFRKGNKLFSMVNRRKPVRKVRFCNVLTSCEMELPDWLFRTWRSTHQPIRLLDFQWRSNKNSRWFLAVGNFCKILFSFQKIKLLQILAKMDENNILDVGRTIELFDLSVEDQMLPHGSNPKGVGTFLKDSKRKLSA